MSDGPTPQAFVGFSGGKDSTAMALRLWELGEKFELLFTPAGNEPLDVFKHIDRVAEIIGAKIVQPPGPDLRECITKNKMLPNHWARFCTRQIKIEPCQKYLDQFPGSILYIGFRADEDEEDRPGGRYYDCEYRTPMRDWGWGLEEVWAKCEEYDVLPPERTDCKLCYGQRLEEWYKLWLNDPEGYQEGVDYEKEYGHTFRSNGRDSWPASLADLRSRFEGGERPRNLTLPDEMLFDMRDLSGCRICKM